MKREQIMLLKIWHFIFFIQGTSGVVYHTNAIRFPYLRVQLYFKAEDSEIYRHLLVFLFSTISVHQYGIMAKPFKLEKQEGLGLSESSAVFFIDSIFIQFNGVGYSDSSSATWTVFM